MGKLNIPKISFSKPFFVLLYFLVSVLIILLATSIRNVEYDDWIKWFSIIILMQFIAQYVFLKKVNVKLFSLTGMFLILSYLFHFGQLLIMGLFPDYEFGRFNFYTFNNSYGMKIASEFSLVAILMVGLGFLLSNNINTDSVSVKCEYNFQQYKKIGWTLIVLTFPIQLYLDFSKLVISIRSGYLDTYNIGISGIWDTIGFISFIGMTLILLGYSNQKKKALLIYFVIIIYLLITMLSGHRGHQITIILFLSYILHKTVYGFKGKKVIIVLLFMFIGMALLNTFAIFRGIEGKTFTVFWEMFLESLRGDSIKDLVVELGGTINSVYLVMQQVPNDIPFAYGTTYPAGIFSIIPNLGNLFGDINTHAHFVKSLNGHALGGSYIGEMYYNFSYFGLPLSIIVGILVNAISNRVEKLIYRKSYYSLAYLAPLFIYLLWWPRDAFGSMLRPFIWGAIALFIVKTIIVKSK